MLTELFVATLGMPLSFVLERVPPRCRSVGPPPTPVLDRTERVVVAPEWAPPAGARHLLPSFSALADVRASFRFELAVRVAGAWTPWVAASGIGDAGFPPMPSCVNGLRVDIDTFVAEALADAVRWRLRVSESSLSALDGPWLITLSASDLGPLGAAPRSRGRRALAVPARSQQTAADPTLAARICSPTSVAMVLDYWRAATAAPSARDARAVDVAELAAEMFHPALDLYGVWPVAIAAAARRGLCGYLLRFPDWASAAWCLDRGLPIVASVRYDEGELTGAAIAKTAGHLLVLRGYDDDRVLVNDPAAATTAAVPRAYALDELARVWLERNGVGYVFFTPP